MLLPQATTIAGLLLNLPGIDYVTIERTYEGNQPTGFRLKIEDSMLDAEGLRRILKYDGAERLWPGGNKGNLEVVYSDDHFLIEDAEPPKEEEKTP